MKLQTTSRTILQVDYSDLEDFVKNVYGGSLEVTATEEKNNYSSIDISVPCKYLIPDKEMEEKIRKGEYPMYSINHVMKCLYEDNYIEEGEYVIKISW